MKTVVIWNEFGAASHGLGVRFFILDGDFSRFDGAYINHSELDQKIQEEILDIVYDNEGRVKIEMFNDFPSTQLDYKFPREWIVIQAGFLP